MMSPIETTSTAAPADTDLVTALQRVFREQNEPLTLPKIRAALPAPFKNLAVEELIEVLRRQVAANVLYQYPKYRSPQERFWDRPMPVHVSGLLRSALEAGPLAWSDLRRKLPGYAQTQAETVLQEQVTQGQLHRHPRVGRGRERFGVQPPDPREYLRAELAQLFERLGQHGFTQEQLRTAAFELLQEQEWSPSRPEASASAPRG